MTPCSVGRGVFLSGGLQPPLRGEPLQACGSRRIASRTLPFRSGSSPTARGQRPRVRGERPRSGGAAQASSGASPAGAVSSANSKVWKRRPRRVVARSNKCAPPTASPAPPTTLPQADPRGLRLCVRRLLSEVIRERRNGLRVMPFAIGSRGNSQAAGTETGGSRARRHAGLPLNGSPRHSSWSACWVSFTCAAPLAVRRK